MTSIVTAPAAVLTTPTVECDPTAPESLAVAGELMEALAATPHALAIAAPQIGSSLSMIVYRDEKNGPTIISNPKIVAAKGKQIGWESCLSFPDMAFWTERPRSVIVEGLDVVGDRLRVMKHDLGARMLCHETDHLKGRLVDTLATQTRRRT